MKSFSRKGAGAIAAAVAGVTLIAAPLDASAGSGHRFKPPMPCVAVRAGVTPWAGFCRSTPRRFSWASRSESLPIGTPLVIWMFR